jgi:hypothetical protein
MEKRIGAMCALFTGLLVLLIGCPTDTLSETGESYIDEAVVINEKAKYRTAATFSFDETDAGKDVTDQFIQLNPGKAADHKVTVSVYSAGENGYFTVQDGRIVFTGVMPVDADLAKKDDGEYEPKEGEEIIERSGISNGEVITLLFQKGDASATLEVLGIIAEKGSEPDEERIAVTEGSTFVIYGYDVIRSSYINRSDVKMTRPILDVIKVNQADMVVQSATTSSLWESATGESVSELIQSLNASLSVGYKGVVFSGKVESEFSTSSNSKTTTRYAKGRGFHITLDERLKNTAPSTLKTLLDDTFKSDINTKDAAYILDSYGTHLISRCYWGGEAEFNYSYIGTELATDTDMKIALNASYGGFSGEGSVAARQKATELNNNSRFTSSSRGGNNTSFTTVEQFTSGYNAWVQSVKANPDLCGIQSFDNSLIPIWTIAAEVNPSKAAQILQEFNTRVNTRGIALAGFVPAYTYVAALNVVEQSGENVPSGYTNLVKTDMYDPDGGGVMDANAGAGGAWIRIAYKKEVGNSNHNAIAELRVANTGNSNRPPNDAGWTTINFDLNKGAPVPYLWLQYRKVNANDTAAIDFIGCYASDGPGSGVILPGYSWVGGSWADRADLNKGNNGTWLYLTVHKSPFKW